MFDAAKAAMRGSCGVTVITEGNFARLQPYERLERGFLTVLVCALNLENE